MNRYFYIPVMDSIVKHEGVSLQDHLRVVDEELFNRELRCYEDMRDMSSDDGILKAKLLKNSSRYSQKTEERYREKKVPRNLVLVLSEEGFYELASEVPMDPIDMSLIEPFEISGVDVVDVFFEHQAYTPVARKFFLQYEKNKSLLEERQDTSLKGKILQKIPFLKDRNS